MTLSRLLLKPLDKMDFSEVGENQGLQEKSKVELKKPRSWEKTQGVVTLGRRQR